MGRVYRDGLAAVRSDFLRKRQILDTRYDALRSEAGVPPPPTAGQG